MNLMPGLYVSCLYSHISTLGFSLENCRSFSKQVFSKKPYYRKLSIIHKNKQKYIIEKEYIINKVLLETEK